jgi:hypothetical protein
MNRLRPYLAKAIAFIRTPLGTDVVIFCVGLAVGFWLGR